MRLSRHSYQNYLLVVGTTADGRGSDNQHDENEFLDDKNNILGRVLNG